MIIYKDFITLNLDKLKLVWQWRNDESVGQFMLNKSIKFEEHLNFIEQLKTSKDKKYFLLFKENQVFGVIYFNNITTKSCEFGLYAKPNLKGVGQILMNEIIKYAFENLKVNTLKAYVFKDNHKALKLYQQNHFTIYDEDKDFYHICLKQSDCKALPS
ncbi:TPA: UDP-4-amino-4,6-dideoxy-N-acetyl-beta-L-altrosamine N-acetyltransferase [Campylobacter jejuni]|uniref:UDP-4-amino-4, 6-dideoxy-N-acetyl-beta-L-altrosamine N-acetyltransferase n=1 Tax=Campylobacter jejuni TaxID=197 RepID=A0A5T1DYC8_CAMJU|nr:UDP-4-amino-4,6-dideoxy-N-acetyl-beta-L-altrosamine N-acetyltransferase [Campylobacter jejuni]EAH6039805.1 UDP-4-amino-4,6-dideoxy-N-acetyl-beta-L-altrosamine N-acetyltransferase [Campylobacter coli]AHW92336.1 N-Acetyltransferase, PseH [Campylobacter jejuni subsp. jejuni R14]AYA32735.1 UDP-4-amino-4,6-dideoxy-N-acetyl-beta-L-altrosamine N-acetyltransferase [Campylobacter jejuni subsp. jejuni]EAJ4537589.1 UDP-4-amino-4,6-dideoxy-N-acetyl-beta-L-altrosamine N-acetyltransferase [Campylobacter j